MATLPEFYINCLRPFPFAIRNEDGAINTPDIIINLLLITWHLWAIHVFFTIPRRYLWLVRSHERVRVLQQLVHTEAGAKRNDLLLDMCFNWTGSQHFKTDELLAHADAKFKIMENAGMVGADGEVLQKLTWGFLEDDLLIGKVLEGRRNCQGLKKHFTLRDFGDLLAMSPKVILADPEKCPRLKKTIEEWKEARNQAQEEKKGQILIDIEE